MVIPQKTAYGKHYDLLASPDGRGHWTTVATEASGDGAVDVIDFPPGFSARLKKLVMKARGTQWREQIWEIELEAEQPRSQLRQVAGPSPPFGLCLAPILARASGAGICHSSSDRRPCLG